jgi:hypothetical protein
MSNEPGNNIQPFILIFLFLIILNLVFLDFVSIKGGSVKPKMGETIVRTNDDLQPLDTQPATTSAVLNQTLFCPDSCLTAINQALATVSGKSTVLTKNIYQTVEKSSQPQTLYLPLGGSAATANTSWTLAQNTSLTFNRDDYPGARFIFEVFAYSKQGAGQARVRLYDTTHQNGFFESEVVASTDSYVKLISGPLPLLSGTNTYQVQVKSSNGYDAYMDGARIKIEY